MRAELGEGSGRCFREFVVHPHGNVCALNRFHYSSGFRDFRLLFFPESLALNG